MFSHDGFLVMIGILSVTMASVVYTLHSVGALK